jgi:hypothetical protein
MRSSRSTQLDAVVITHCADRQMIEGMIGEFAKPGVTFDQMQSAADGPLVNIVWKADTAGSVYDLGTETYVLVDCKLPESSQRPSVRWPDVG